MANTFKMHKRVLFTDVHLNNICLLWILHSHVPTDQLKLLQKRNYFVLQIVIYLKLLEVINYYFLCNYIYWQPQHRRLVVNAAEVVNQVYQLLILTTLFSMVYFGIIIVVITIIIIMNTPGDDSDNNEQMKMNIRRWGRWESIQLKQQGIWSGLGFIMLRFQ